MNTSDTWNIKELVAGLSQGVLSSTHCVSRIHALNNYAFSLVFPYSSIPTFFNLGSADFHFCFCQLICIVRDQVHGCVW